MIRAILVFSLLMMLNSVSQAAALPAVAPGDTWTFYWKKIDAAGIKHSGREQFLISSSGTGDLLVKRRTGSYTDIHGSAASTWPDASEHAWHVSLTACLIDPRGADLGDGQTICQTGFNDNSNWTSSGAQLNGRLKTITALDSRYPIFTIAGAFQAYKIESTQVLLNEKSGAAPETLHMTYWYSQQAKTMVKMDSERIGNDGKIIEKDEWELMTYKVSGTVPDMSKEEMQAQLARVDERISGQITSFTNCRNSNAYQLSRTADAIVELRRLPSVTGRVDIEEPLKNLFTTFKSLGGSADEPAKVKKTADPCQEFSDRLVADIGAETALQKSAGIFSNEPDSSFQTAIIDFSSCKKPDDPRLSLYLEQEGTIRIAFLIGAYGLVNYSFVERSSGVMVLDDVAHEALSKCHFIAGKRNGQPISTWTHVDYVFKLPS